MENYSAHLIDAGLTFIDNAVLVHGFDNALVRELPAIPTFKGLGELALKMIDKRGTRFAYVSGPMRSGPLGYIGNAREMDKLCTWLVKPKHSHDYLMQVFYQLVFQVEIHRIRETKYVDQDDAFIQDLCRDFSAPILNHELLGALVVMPGAHHSVGSCRELEIYRKRKYSRKVPVLFAERLTISQPENT